MGRQQHPGEPSPALPAYRMRISRLTVDKLGVKLYDRVSAVIAELVANGYDADATKVTISAPMGELLAEKHSGELKDKGYVIEVTDNGHGMTPKEVNEFYLVVGAERRNDPKRGNESRKFKRRVMGRKGVGKLAPLGICERIEVITSGGKKKSRGSKAGYLTAHIILFRTKMMKDTDRSYFPQIGQMDRTLQPKRGTTIRMSEFDHRRVPTIDDFDRQLAQRFGVQSTNWKLFLKDSEKTLSSPDAKRIVGSLDIALKPNTKIEFREVKDKSGESYIPKRFGAFTENGEPHEDLRATFEHEGKDYPVTGWMAYSKDPYRDDLMAGVRIYCRDKIAAQTHIFNMKAGFTGEYDVRSYLVGVLNADWLDDEEDLIRTDRQDILWSYPLGKAFEGWGQKAVRVIGTLTREPMRMAAWDLFKDKTKIERTIAEQFPGDHQDVVREKTLEIAKTIVKSARPEELEDKKHCRSLVDLALLLGPHITLEHQLIEATKGSDRTLEAVTNILRVARVAELTSFGRIADDRVKVIERVEELKDADASEEDFHGLIEQTPWLINPQWSPISDNQILSNLKKKFSQFYKQQTGELLHIYDGHASKVARRSSVVTTAQFVMTTQETSVEIIEIKKPGHSFQNIEMDRLALYHNTMDAFFHANEDEEILKGFEKFHITLVCDYIGLKGSQKIAFDGMRDSGGLTQVSWTSFLKRTRKMHEAFLAEAERQKKDAGKL